MRYSLPQYTSIAVLTLLSVGTLAAPDSPAAPQRVARLTARERQLIALQDLTAAVSKGQDISKNAKLPKKVQDRIAALAATESDFYSRQLTDTESRLRALCSQRESFDAVSLATAITAEDDHRQGEVAARYGSILADLSPRERGATQAHLLNRVGEGESVTTDVVALAVQDRARVLDAFAAFCRRPAHMPSKELTGLEGAVGAPPVAEPTDRQ